MDRKPRPSAQYVSRSVIHRLRTVRGRIDPRTRVRRLEQIDLWEISIVTFPLLAGARVRAVEKEQGGSVARHASTPRGRAVTAVNRRR